MSQRVALLVALSVLVATAPLLSCGGGGNGDDPFMQCGNGRIDPGERCDDGNTNDTDDCTSACQLARCGDGVVHAGVEQCDGLDMDGADCSTLGLSGSGLRCNLACQYDTSPCGPAFTPTATPTTTPSATETPTVTPTFLTAPPTETPTPTVTPTPNPCGDGFLDPGETCDSCPADCQVLSCPMPGMPAEEFRVDLSAPAGTSPTGVAVLIGYRSDRVSLPGAGSGPAARIQNRPAGTSQLVNDLDYAVRVTIVAQSGNDIPSGELFTIDFDSCAEAPPVDPANFGCTVQSCGSSFGPIDDCACVVGLPADMP